MQVQLHNLEDALEAARVAGDSKAMARILNQSGELYLRTSDYQKALEAYNQAMALASSAEDMREKAAALNGMGNCYGSRGEQQKAAEVFQKALDLTKISGDEKGQATAQTGMGWIDNMVGQNQKALDFHNLALPLARKIGDNDLQATVLRRIGAVYYALGQEQKAQDYFRQSLPLYRSVGDRAGEGKALANIGLVYDDLGQGQKALEYYTQALSVVRDAGDRASEASMLMNIGVVYSNLWEKQKALEYYNQALPIVQAVGDRDSEARSLGNIAKAYSDLGERQKALDFYDRALPIFREVGDRNAQTTLLNNVGGVYDTLGEKEKALNYYDQALPIERVIGDRGGEARTLSNIAVIYYELGKYREALTFYAQALTGYRQVGDRNGEANGLNNSAAAYSQVGERRKALEYYNRALSIRRKIGDKGGEAETLTDIGVVYSDLRQPRKALPYFAESLPIERAIGDRVEEASTLSNMGEAYSRLGESIKARNNFDRALPLASAIGDPIRQAYILYGLMLSQKKAQPALATFWGKQSVNLLQQIRTNIKGLEIDLQKSFLATVEDHYHDLADLLIRQGRLAEAQQVMDLLKQQEYSDYVRGDTTTALAPLTLTPAEEQAAQDYQRTTTQLVSLGQQWTQLKAITTRTPEQEKQYQQISEQLDAASKGLNDYYARLYVLFSKDSDANKQVGDVKGEVSLLKQSIAKSPHTVALYTLVGKNRTSTLVITTSATVAREYAISEGDLNKKVAAFEQVLRNPGHDPRPLAQDLYKILIAPVKSDLDQAEAQIIVWSLDGVLRYIPMAALYDGNHYLVERYSTVTITPASFTHLSEKPDLSDLNAAAMGISLRYEPDLPPLPAVVSELDEIVKDPQARTTHGVLPGTILLDGQFTEKAMEDQLGSQHAVVHIASHFVFKPGDDGQSYLLLAGKDREGAGYHLTVADFRDNQKLSLDDTDLLTLSACETGMGSNASNGREIDGLGTMAQLKGAKAVISSLWEVDDSSTGNLMADFYERWAGGVGKVTKVEALREAQLDLLFGKVNSKPDAKGRGFELNESDTTSTGFAHPFYWAPFVLMGNWR
jgi:CHAT domain-containing protein/Tfp pilus assembly protein PilF